MCVCVCACVCVCVSGYLIQCLSRKRCIQCNFRNIVIDIINTPTKSESLICTKFKMKQLKMILK